LIPPLFIYLTQEDDIRPGSGFMRAGIAKGTKIVRESNVRIDQFHQGEFHE